MKKFLAFILFIKTNAFYVWLLPALSYLQGMFFISGGLYAYKYKKNVNQYDIIFSLLLSFLFLWYNIRIGKSIFVVIVAALLPIFLITPIFKKRSIVLYFVKTFYPLCLLVSICSYLLFILGIFSLPSLFVPSPNEAKYYDYIAYIFFVIPTNIEDIGRFCSFYDEPGLLGTLCSTIIFFYYRSLNKYQFLVYFIAGMLSLSLFFVLMFVYSMIVYEGFKLFVKFKYILISLLAILLVYNLWGEEYIDQKLLSRFNTEKGIISDNRNSEDFEDYFYNNFIYTNDLWFGVGVKGDRSKGSSSIQNTIYKNGLLFVLFGLFIYALIFLRYKSTNKLFILSFLFWLGLTYQRPNFCSIFFLIIIYTSLESNFYLYKKNEKSTLYSIQ